MSADTRTDEQKNNIHWNSGKQIEFDQEAITKEIRQGFKNITTLLNTMNNTMNTRLLHIEEMMEKEQVCCSIL
jgi:hypothetical protein